VAFNETFSFNSMDNDLRVRVMDEDTFSDDELGLGQINVAQYRQQSFPQDGTKSLIQFKLSVSEIRNLPAKCS